MNEKQQEAVLATEGPVLVIAGAGSGKTRVLTERIVHLVRQKEVAPRNILAFTFTNKAAQEMKERLERSIPGISGELWVGTFHATGVRILRRHGDRIGLARNFAIYDSDDSLMVVKELYSKRLQGVQFARSPNSVRDSFSRWKNELLTPELLEERVGSDIERQLVAMYREYERSLRRANALDFDDLIMKVVELFSIDADAKNYYARRFRYVLVDEFQDTNPIQMALIDALSSHHRNLFVVGDDDQSIYSWRGAKVDHILNFENLYAETYVVRLEQNYRSTQTILEAANHLIAHNRGRKGKNLWTSGAVGDKVRLVVSMDEETEAVNVLHAVNALLENGHALREIAVLYRTNAQSRALEDVLKLGSLPYQIIGAARFYERTEVRDILAYCKLLVNPSDDVSLKRILNVPRRGLGKTTVGKIASRAGAKDLPMMEILKRGDVALPAAQARRCEEFVRLYAELAQLTAVAPAPRVIEGVMDALDYRSYLRQNYPDGSARVENAEELINAAEARTEGEEDRSLRVFLEKIALVADIDTLDETREQLTLMTLHNAKGLEFDCVIISGLEDGLFPHYNSLDEPEALEEERRLFYVGMTRARKRLFLSFANMRRRMGAIEGALPSRFLFEIPSHCLEGTLEAPDAWPARRGLESEWEARVGEAGLPGRMGRVTPFADALAERDDYSQEQVEYAVGTRILHRDFGRGIVRKVEGRGDELRVSVIFDGGGERKFIARLAPMRPI